MGLIQISEERFEYMRDVIDAAKSYMATYMELQMGINEEERLKLIDAMIVRHEKLRQMLVGV